MADYRYYFADLLSDDVLGEIPAISGSYGEGLNAEGSFKATAPLRALDSHGRQMYDMNNLTPGKVGIFVERDGVIVWGGVLWVADTEVGNDTLSLEASDFLSLFRRRFIRRTLGYKQVTGPRIAADLITYAESDGGNADYGLDTDGALAAGIGRDRTYFGYERKEIASAIVDLANLRGGFDFRFLAQRLEDGRIHKRFTTTYPSTGRMTAIHLALGSNIEGLKIKDSAASMASRVDAGGGGDAESSVFGTFVEATTYPLYEDIISFSDEHSKENLIDHAARRVSRGRAPIISAGIRCRGDNPSIGSFVPGDIVRVTAQHGWVDLDVYMRITEYEVSVTDTGQDSTNINVVSLNAFDEFGH